MSTPEDFLTQDLSPDIEPAEYSIENSDQVMARSGLDPERYKLLPPDLPQSSGPALNSPDAITQALTGMRNFHAPTVTNPLAAGKAQPFGAGPDHHFYERYYEHPKFDDLGFSPFRDNEAIYNENSTAFDDFIRAQPQMFNLVGLGFSDAMGFGDLSDTDRARDFERAMSVGQSSREGLGAFTTNLFLNSGYTFGIIGEIAAEEVALAGLTVLTGGAAAPLAGARTAVNIGRGAYKINKAFSAGKNILKALDNLKDINKARQYFKNAGSSTAAFFNPAQHTMDYFKNLNKLSNLSDFARTSVGFGSFYRDVRNVRLAWGESALEAGMVENQLNNELTQEFIAEHDRNPNDAEDAIIRDKAVKAATTTAVQNVGLIFYSNKIVLDNLMRPFNPVRRLTQDLVESGAAGKIFFNRKAAKDAFEIVESNWKGFLKTAKNPRAYARTGLNYFKANFAEGFQEIGQEIVSGATMDYYKKHYDPDEPWYGSAVKGAYWSSVADNLIKQVSPEGFEIFMSGFLMGGMVQPVTKIPGYVKNKYQQFKDPENYAKLKTEKEEYLTNTVNTLNDMYNDPAKYFAPDLENLVNQDGYAKGMKKASQNGDSKAWHDLKDASVYDHVFTALKLGRIDTYTERLDDMKNLSDEEIKQTYRDISPAEFRKGIDNAVDRAKKIEARYDLVQNKYSNPFNPSQFKYGSEEYIEAALNKRAWENAQRDFSFMQHSFDRTLERMTAIMGAAKEDTQLKEVTASDFNVMFSVEDTQHEINQLKQELKAMGKAEEIITPEQKKFRKQKARKLELLEEFAVAIDDLVATPVEAPKEGQEDSPLQRDGKQIDLDSGPEGPAVKKAYISYEKYLKFLTQDTKDRVFTEHIEKSFQKLLDFYTLNDDANKLTDSVNALTDPAGFTRHAARLAEVMRNMHANRKAQIESMLKQFIKAKEFNDLLQLLYDEGMFFDPQESVNLFENGTLPTQFFYTLNKEEVLENSPDYAKALNMISQYVKEIMDMPIPEAKAEPYNTTTRNKINNDQRNYADLAKQFGFDPQAAETQVPLKQVLRSIIDSPNATYREKALAKQLEKIASDDEHVIFARNLSTPGEYSTTFQTKIDARYNSRDYRGGTMPIEHVILHEEIHRRTVEELEKDGTFRGDIKKIMDAVNEHLKDPKVREKWGQLPLYGTKNDAEFVAEAMSNDYFQSFLADVSYEETGASTWTEFVDSVIKFLKKLFGARVNNTALNAAMNIITARIDTTYGDVTEQEKTDIKGATVEGGGIKLTKQTPINEIATNHPELASQLVQAYKEENARREQQDEDPLDPAWANKTDEQILKSAMFGTYFRGPWSKVANLIKDYNTSTGRTVDATRAPGTTAQPVPEPTTASIPIIITRDMKQQLADLGYNWREQTPSSAWHIINEGITQEEREAREVAAQVETQEDIDAQRQAVRSNIAQLIAAPTTLKELEAAEAEVLAVLSNPALRTAANLTGSEIDSMIKAKKEDLAFSFTFVDIQQGEVIMLNDKRGTKLVVEEKTSDTLKTYRIDDISVRINIKVDEVRDQVKFRYSPALEEVQVTPEEISPQEKTLSNEDVSTAKDMTDNESIQKDLKKGKDSSDNELNDDLLDDINECE